MGNKSRVLRSFSASVTRWRHARWQFLHVTCQANLISPSFGLHMTLILSASLKSSYKHQCTIRSHSYEDVPALAKILKETDTWQYARIIDSWLSGRFWKMTAISVLVFWPRSIYIVMHGTEMIGERFWHCCLQATTLKSTSPEPLYLRWTFKLSEAMKIVKNRSSSLKHAHPVISTVSKTCL